MTKFTQPRDHDATPPELGDPLVNRGTGYTLNERRSLGLEGFLPPAVQSLDEQCERVLNNVRILDNALDKYRYLSEIQNFNEVLYYRVILDNMEEMLPVVYTPTVGEACTQWGRIYERNRGIYLSAFQHQGRIADILKRWPNGRAGIIVVTDGGRILGLGDLGVYGMGIPIGKLALYTVCAGVSPALCLPVSLDVGTQNTMLHKDPLYLGERKARLSGEEYESFMEEFVTAVQEVFPDAILHFEDFNNAAAFYLLEKYGDRLCCFNDDVQGTGAMGLAGIYAAGRITGKKLSDQRILFVGAGEAGLGMGNIIAAAMQEEGLSASDARSRLLYMDSRGLISSGRSDLNRRKRQLALDLTWTSNVAQVIDDFTPTALIGCCGQGARFNEATLQAMLRHNDRPIVFALSNPTSKAECTAEQAYRWTKGRAIYASGSPFDAVTIEDFTHVPGQGNNAFIFPGVGLGILVSGASRVTDEMFFAAAKALTACVTSEDLDQGRIFPAASRMREVSIHVATAVANVAYEQNLASVAPAGNLSDVISDFMYEPGY